MKYMGSKNKHAKNILSIILKNKKSNQWYIEPFAGGMNTMDKVSGNRIANDLHYYLMQMWDALINDDWIPPKFVNEIQYQSIRKNPEKYEPWLVGFVGFGCSYSGKWFGGYARGKANNGQERNYCYESKKNVLKQVPKLKGVVLKNESYQNLVIPPNSLIYCDPPYRNTTKYKDVEFNFDSFWRWCESMSQKGHTVFVSEYNAPRKFEEIWRKETHNTLVKNTGSKRGIEKLFTI